MSSEHEKFIENVSYIKDGGQKIHRVVHINCGDGLYYELCNESLPDVEYLGYASSKKSAELLKSSSFNASQANDIVEIGVFNSWVILLIKSVLIVDIFFCL